jgi:hypothetical protein
MTGWVYNIEFKGELGMVTVQHKSEEPYCDELRDYLIQQVVATYIKLEGRRTEMHNPYKMYKGE